MRLLFTLVALSVYASVSAQNTSPYWSLAGNSTATTSSKLGTTNSAPLRLMTKNLERMRIDSNGRVSIGTLDAFGKLSVLNGSSIPGTPWKTTAPVLSAFGENTSGSADFVLSMASNTPNARSVFFGKRARGTLAAPSALKQGDYLMSFYTGAYDGSKFQNPANIDFIVDTTTGLGKIPTKLSFVTGTSATTKKERMRIGSNGDIVLNNNQAEFKAIGEKRIVSLDNNHFRMTSTNNPGVDASETVADSAIWRAKSFLIADISSTEGMEPSMDPDAVLNVYGRSKPYAATFQGNTGLRVNGSNVGLIAETEYNYHGVGVQAKGNTGMTVYGEETGLVVTSHGRRGMIIENTGDLEDGRALALEVTGRGVGTGIRATGINGIVGYGTGYYEEYDHFGVYGGTDYYGPGVLGYSHWGVGVKGTSDSSHGVFGSTISKSSYAGYFTGRVYASGGLYTASDRKLKQNVKDLTSATNIIAKLKPKSYEYKHEGSLKLMNLPQGIHYGLIAQEVEEVLPNVVHASEYNTKLARKAPSFDSLGQQVPSNEEKLTNEKINFKAVNYTELIPVMIKGMQEQQETIEEQKQTIQNMHQKVDDLSNEVSELKAMVSKLVNGSNAGASLSNASLGTASPNPVKGSTVINYNIPEGSKAAHLLVTDMKGSVVKQILLNSRGESKITLNTAALAVGTYTYSLHVDGSKVDSKQLLITR